jgi:glycosyltransferase involved in cell wall biosynthesis
MLGEGEFIGAFDGTTEVLGEIREWEAMCRWADHVVVNSPIVRDEFKEIVAEAGANVEKCAGKIMLISSGCTEDFLMSDEFVRHKLENIPECINLVTFCRIDPSKGVEFSIRGAKAAGRSSKQKFCLTIAGIPSSDEYVAQLKKELDDIPGNLEVKFKLLDAISPPSEKKEILDNKHIYLLPTLKEPFGMSLIEASARGNMVVSADTNGPKFMFGSSSGQDLGWGIITGCGVLAKITEDYQSNFAENVGKAITWIIDNWTGSVKGVLEFNKKIRNTWTWESIARQYLELFRN